MSSLSKVMVSPHIHSGKSTAGIMGDVLIALLPATIAGVIIFGERALSVILVCVLSAIGFEFLLIASPSGRKPSAIFPPPLPACF